MLLLFISNSSMSKSFNKIELIEKDKIDLSPNEVYHLLIERNKVVLIDLREEWEVGNDAIHEDNLIYIPLNKMHQVEYTLPHDIKLIFVCNDGLQSKDLVKRLINKGRKNVAYMSDGIIGWKKENLPLKVDVYKEYSNAFFCQINKRPRNYKDDKYDN